MSKERELLNRMAEQLRTVLFLSDDAKQLIAEYDAVTAPDQPKDAEPVAWTDEWLRDKMENAVCPACGNTGLHACTGPSAPSADRRDAERYRMARKKLMLDVADEIQIDRAVQAIARDAQNARKGEDHG